MGADGVKENAKYLDDICAEWDFFLQAPSFNSTLGLEGMRGAWQINQLWIEIDVQKVWWECLTVQNTVQ